MAKKVKGPRPKHVPQRICIACRQSSIKRELIRIVRTVSGEVEIDLTGKLAGRGAYLCRERACWELALKKRAIEHALQVTLSPQNRATLAEYCRQLAPTDTAAGEKTDVLHQTD